MNVKSYYEKYAKINFEMKMNFERLIICPYNYKKKLKRKLKSNIN